MRLENECVTCVLNQMIRVSHIAGLDPVLRDRVFAATLKEASEINTQELTSPEFAGEIYQVFAGVSGIADPYKALRKDQNDWVLKNIEFFKGQVENSGDPLYAAGLYSLLGNIIDYGGVEIFDRDLIFSGIDDLKLAIDDYSSFKEKLITAGRILIIGDNAGEAVFDRLFIEEILKINPNLQVIYGVRSGPAINDMLLEDAYYIGLEKVACVIETGATFAGTVVSRSTPQFQEIYQSADIVISKGQGNYETLEQEDREILFIFKVKCPVVADYSGIPLGSLLFAFNQSLNKFRPT